MINNLLITGSTSGIGQALTLHFADLGYHVYAIGRNKQKLKELISYSQNITAIQADICNSDDLDNILTQLEQVEHFSVIHSAIYAEPCNFTQLTEENIRYCFEVNYIAPVLLTQRLLPYLQDGQRILHISSGAATLPLAGLSQYCASKSAFQHLINCLNTEFNERGVYCANLRPGMVDTPLQARWRNIETPFLNQSFYIDAYQEKKLILPQVVAKFISWVILKTDNLNYSQTQWNIYDEYHHDNWLGADDLYQL